MLIQTIPYSLTPATLSGHAYVAALRLAGLPRSLFGRTEPVEFLHFGTAKVLSKLVSREQTCEISLPGGGRFRFDLADPYWARTTSANFNYEGEILRILELFAKEPFYFIDGGANFGYWSVLVSSRWNTCRRIIAVEAAPPTYERLKQNAALNGDAFEVMNRALFSEDGKEITIEFEAGRHAAAHVSAEAGKRGFAVTTATLDSLAAQMDDKTIPLVIKLDVEGVELSILRSLGAIYDRPFAVIFEDHGRDTAGSVASEVLGDGKLSVYYMRDDGQLTHINSAAQAMGIKKAKRRGYDFLGTPKDGAIDRMLQARLV